MSSVSETSGVDPVVNWRSVGCFYLIACSISWPIFWWRDFRPEDWAGWGAPGYIKGLLPAIGPALAAVLTLAIFHHTHRRTITLMGTSLWRSVLFLATPAIVLGAWGVGEESPHCNGLWWGAVLATYGLGEELGWRGFLQDAVRPLAPVTRYAVIGGLWGAWHFTTFLHGTSAEVVVRLSIMLALWFGGSWGIGLLTDRTGSVAVAASVHLIFNYMNLLPLAVSATVLVVSIGVWIALLRRWPPNPVLYQTPTGTQVSGMS